MKLGEKISILRKARGFSQEQLGLSLSTKNNGVSRQTVSDWENGKTEPTLEHVRALATLLDVSYDSLLDEELDLSNPEYLSEVLAGSFSSSKEVLSNKNYFIYKRSFGLIFIFFFILIAGICLALIIPSLQKAQDFFAQSAARNGDQSVMGQNLKNRAVTYLSLTILGGVIASIALPIDTVLFIKEIRSSKAVGVMNEKEIVIYPRYGKNQNKTTHVLLNDVDVIKKKGLGIDIKSGDKKIHLFNIKYSRDLINTFNEYKNK